MLLELKCKGFLTPRWPVSHSERTVSESSSLNEVTFSFSTASSPEWSHKTVYATLGIINLLASIGLDGSTEDSVYPSNLKWARAYRVRTASVSVFKAAAGQLVSSVGGWGAEANLLLDGQNRHSLSGNLWGRLAEESMVCRRNEESFHLLWA